MQILLGAPSQAWPCPAGLKPRCSHLQAASPRPHQSPLICRLGLMPSEAEAGAVSETPALLLAATSHISPPRWGLAAAYEVKAESPLHSVDEKSGGEGRMGRAALPASGGVHRIGSPRALSEGPAYVEGHPEGSPSHCQFSRSRSRSREQGAWEAWRKGGCLGRNAHPPAVCTRSLVLKNDILTTEVMRVTLRKRKSP